MRRSAMFFLLLAGLLTVSVSCSEGGAGRHGMAVGLPGRTERFPGYVEPLCDPATSRGQCLPATAFCLSQPPHRVVSPRPSRYLPLGSGKTENQGRWAASGTPGSLHRPFGHLRRGQAGLRAALAPPRFYYVIALRRILC